MHKIVATSLRSLSPAMESAGKRTKDFNTFCVLSFDTSIADERPHNFVNKLVLTVLLVFLNCNLLYRLFLKI